MFYECFSLCVALEFKIKWLLLVAEEITGLGSGATTVDWKITSEFQFHTIVITLKIVTWVKRYWEAGKNTDPQLSTLILI